MQIYLTRYSCHIGVYRVSSQASLNNWRGNQEVIHHILKIVSETKARVCRLVVRVSYLQLNDVWVVRPELQSKGGINQQVENNCFFMNACPCLCRII